MPRRRFRAPSGSGRLLRSPGPLAALIVATASCGLAAAQELAPPQDGIVAGRLVLRPSIEFTMTRNSNVRYASEDLQDSVLSTGIFGIQPRILVEVPLSSMRLRANFAALLRQYTSQAVIEQEDVSHFLDVEGVYRGPTFGLRLKDHYTRDTIDLVQFDEGREVVGFAPFRVHDAELQADAGFGVRQGLSVIGRVASARFNERGDADFFGYDRAGFETRYNYRLGPTSTLYAFYSLESLDQNRSENFFEVTDTNERRSGIGLRRTSQEKVVTSLAAGHTTLRFPDHEGDFSGLTLSADGTWQLSDAARLEAGFRREPLQSFFLNSRYYDNSQIRLRMLRQVGRSVYWVAGVTWQRNSYPLAIDTRVPGLDAVEDQRDCSGAPGADGRPDIYESYCPSLGIGRRDSVLQLEFGGGYRILRALRLSVGYNLERRASNVVQRISGEMIDPYDYRVHRIMLKIEAGWL